MKNYFIEYNDNNGNICSNFYLGTLDEFYYKFANSAKYIFKQIFTILFILEENDFYCFDPEGNYLIARDDRIGENG